MYGHHTHRPQRSHGERTPPFSIARSLTKDADFLAHHGPFLQPIKEGRIIKRMGGLKERGLKYHFHLKYTCV